MPLAHLSIGTSSNRINLLNESGFMLDDWQVGGTEYGTIFQESQLADFRQMAAYRDVTTFESFDLKLRSNSQDIAARQIQDMRAVIRLCLDFWSTTWQTSVVYLAARASCETNMRYAVAHDARLVGESNPFGQPFLQSAGNAVMDALNLIVERGPWLENAPGTGTAVEIGTTQTYDGRTVGNVDSTGTEELSTDALTVFAGNKHNVAQLTDIWYWDNSAGAWNGANLMDAALPFAFMPPAPLQVDDFVLFGIDTSIPDSGPFSSLVFDIGTALGVGGGITIEWRWSGNANVDPAAWLSLTVQDNTNAAGAMTGDAFDTTDIYSVHWEQPQAWAAYNPDPGGAALGVTGYWVCAYVTAAAGAPTPPQQANRDIYTVTWPYIDIDADQTEGDMPSLLRLSVDNRASQDGVGTTTDLWCQRVIAGLRSYDRGADFSAYINLSDEQNTPGSVVTVIGGTTTFGDYPFSPTGRAVRYFPAGVEAMADRVYIRLTPDFYGRHHVFVRGGQWAGALGTVDVRLSYAAMGSYFPETHTATKQFLNTNDDQLIDFGEIALGPYADTYPLEVSHTFIHIGLSSNAGAATVYLYELILIPVDEWAIDSEDMFKNTGALGYTNDYWSHLEIDGIRNQRRLLSFLIGTTSGHIARYWRPITNGIPILQTGKHQRLWLLSARYDDYADADDLRADSEICSTVQVWRNQRYTTLRGDR